MKTRNRNRYEHHHVIKIKHHVRILSEIPPELKIFQLIRVKEMHAESETETRLCTEACRDQPGPVLSLFNYSVFHNATQTSSSYFCHYNTAKDEGISWSLTVLDRKTQRKQTEGERCWNNSLRCDFLLLWCVSE